jgi:glycosyltransferase involved in cell wall biosynthesis
MQMCAALARHGHDVTLVAKRGVEPTGDGGDHAFYGVPESFRIDKLPRPKRRGGGLVYAAGVAARIATLGRRADVIYCRDLVGAVIAGGLGLPVVFEAHGLPAQRWMQAAWRRLVAAPRFRGLVVISEALRADVDAAGLAPPRAPVVVAHDAADAPVNGSARASLGAPPRVGYVGNLYPGRGVEMAIELARRMPGARFHIVGGSADDIARWQASSLPGNLVLHGFQAPASLHRFYREIDVLLMPYPRSAIVGPTRGLDTSRWCSPMKMFEYMASGAPMVSSDLPVLQEVLRDEHNALIAPAGDADAWQRAVERLLGDAQLRQRLAGAALEDLRRDYTWDARVERVVGGLSLTARSP